MGAIRSLLSSPAGDVSSKRIIGLWGALNATAFIWIFVYVGKLDASTGLWAFMTMVGGGVLGATFDHFGKGRDGQ